MAATLESMGHERELTDAGGALSVLEREVARIEAELITWRASRAASSSA